MKKKFTQTILSLMTTVIMMWIGTAPVKAQCNIYLDSLVTPKGDTMVFCNTTCAQVVVYKPANDPTNGIQWQISNAGNQNNIDSVIITQNRGVSYSLNTNFTYKVVIRFVGVLSSFTMNDTIVCPGTPVVFDPGVTPPYATYAWSNASTTQQITVSDTGEYSLSITNACGAVFDTVKLTNFPVVPLNLGTDQAICDSSTLITNNTNVTSYLWSTGETTQSITAKISGVYALEIVDTNSCKTSDTITISATTPYDYPPIDVVGHDTTSNTCNVLTFNPSIPAKVDVINIYRKVGNTFVMQGNLPTGYFQGGFQDCGLDNSAFSAEYRITTSDSCGHEGLPGPVIQTCLVQKSFYQNTLSIFWNPYTIDGKDTVLDYNLVGIDGQGVHTVIYSGMSNSLLTCNVSNPDPNMVYHYISYGLPPAGTWKTMGPVEGRSNYSKDLVTGQREYEAYKSSQVRISAHDGQIKVETSQAVKSIEVYNILGQMLFTPTEREFSLSQNGVFFVQVTTPTGVTTKRIVN